jgi:DNA polymerase III epsilon subunit-like protein
MAKKESHPRLKVLIFDIETAPITAFVWGLWENNVGLNQIAKDWHVMSWAAKWLGSDELFYEDQRKAKIIEDDHDMLRGIWKLLDEADVVITQNGKAFDRKKLNARFIINGFLPPSSYRHIDTKVLAKKHFGFTSASLEYMAGKLCVKYKKLKHAKFAGFELWKECLAGNHDAWNEMERYNKHDVLVLEELYKKLQPWERTINFNVFSDDLDRICNCGSTEFKRNGYVFTETGKYQRFFCKSCRSETRGTTNLLSKEKRKSLQRKA